jgi:hypothetical protein
MAQEEEPSLLLAQIDYIALSVPDGGGRNPTGGVLTGGVEERHGGLVGWGKSVGGMDVVSSGARVPTGASVKKAPAEKEQGFIGKSDGKERPVHIVEEKVYATLGGEGNKDPRRWVLDTKPSNHMMGSWVAFSNIDTGATDTVQFGDRSVVRIEG